MDFVGRHSTLKTNDTMAEDNQQLESHNTNHVVSEVTLTNTGTPLIPLLLSKIGKIILKNETSSTLRKKAYSCRRYRRRNRASQTISSASEEASEDVKKMDYPPLSSDDMGVIQR